MSKFALFLMFEVLLSISPALASASKKTCKAGYLYAPTTGGVQPILVNQEEKGGLCTISESSKKRVEDFYKSQKSPNFYAQTSYPVLERYYDIVNPDHMTQPVDLRENKNQAVEKEHNPISGEYMRKKCPGVYVVLQDPEDQSHKEVHGAALGLSRKNHECHITIPQKQLILSRSSIEVAYQEKKGDQKVEKLSERMRKNAKNLSKKEIENFFNAYVMKMNGKEYAESIADIKSSSGQAFDRIKTVRNVDSQQWPMKLKNGLFPQSDPEFKALEKNSHEGGCSGAYIAFLFKSKGSFQGESSSVGEENPGLAVEIHAVNRQENDGQCKMNSAQENLVKKNTYYEKITQKRELEQSKNFFSVNGEKYFENVEDIKEELKKQGKTYRWMYGVNSQSPGKAQNMKNGKTAEKDSSFVRLQKKNPFFGHYIVLKNPERKTTMDVHAVSVKLLESQEYGMTQEQKEKVQKTSTIKKKIDFSLGGNGNLVSMQGKIYYEGLPEVLSQLKKEGHKVNKIIVHDSRLEEQNMKNGLPPEKDPTFRKLQKNPYQDPIDCGAYIVLRDPKNEKLMEVHSVTREPLAGEKYGMSEAQEAQVKAYSTIKGVDLSEKGENLVPIYGKIYAQSIDEIKEYLKDRKKHRNFWQDYEKGESSLYGIHSQIKDQETSEDILPKNDKAFIALQNHPIKEQKCASGYIVYKYRFGYNIYVINTDYFEEKKSCHVTRNQENVVKNSYYQPTSKSGTLGQSIEPGQFYKFMGEGRTKWALTLREALERAKIYNPLTNRATQSFYVVDARFASDSMQKDVRKLVTGLSVKEDIKTVEPYDGPLRQF